MNLLIQILNEIVMKRKSLILAFALTFISWLSFGQGYTFKVLANKGANEVNRGGEWSALKTGASLNENDELKISENAYLGLVHSSGKTLELKEEGTHKISSLASQINTAGSSVASKYADFVLSKMSAEGKKNKLSATGAVSRGSEDAIKIFMPNSVGVFSQEPILKWSEVEGDDVTYTLTVKNMFEDQLLQVTTTDPHYQIDLNNEKLADQNVVLITVASSVNEDSKSGTYAIKRLPISDMEKVKTTLNELMSGVNEPTALNKYILAGFYEENNLLVDALTNYLKAMELAPEVDSYKEAYEEFLLRNRLSE
jgi:hypothetical protein